MESRSPTHRVVTGAVARSKIVHGARVLAEAVGSTIGPGGQTVLIERPGQGPLITKDGVTVARSICLADPLESLGAELVKEVASRTNDISGDGTTTATVLAHAILANGHKVLSSGHTPSGVKQGIEVATNLVLMELAKNTKVVSGTSDIEAIGTISANGDQEVGKLLATAIEKVGPEGTITVEVAKGTKTTLEVLSGFNMDTGFWSTYFITNRDRMVCHLEDPFILITNRKISTTQEILPLVQEVHKTKQPLLLVVDDIDQEPLNLLVANHIKGNLRACVIKAPFYGEVRSEVLRDLASVTGGEVFDISQPLGLKDARLAHLGRAEQVKIGKTNTIVVGKRTQESITSIQETISGLREALRSESFTDQETHDRARKRLARLQGGVAVIRVGGLTEPEILEKKDRVEDALNATLAATQEGVVAGGGVALFHAARTIRKSMVLDPKFQVLTGDEHAGFKVLVESCEAPLKQIVRNTGTSPEVVTSKLAEMYDASENNFLGWDATTSTFTDMVEQGIIDPVKVTRTALEHASSVASLVLTCNAVVVEDTQPRKESNQE